MKLCSVILACVAIPVAASIGVKSSAKQTPINNRDKAQAVAKDWRQAALKRIERVRKADMTIIVQDAKGQPVNGAMVRVQMHRHAFNFGTALNRDVWSGSGGYVNGRFKKVSPATVSRYRQSVTKLFNSVTPENNLKWPFMENQPQQTLAMIKWARTNNLRVHGHALVWAGWKNLPANVKRLQHDKIALRRLVNNHIATTTARYRGLVTSWDVINEPQYNRDLMNILGHDAMVEWFQIARRSDPKARLFLNEGTGVNRNAPLEKTTRFLISKGAPLTGIGLQNHAEHSRVVPAKALAALDYYSTLVREVQVSEYDMASRNDKLQADNLRDLLTICFSHPVVSGFSMWGFWDGSHWRNNAPLFRSDWSAKPALKVWMQLTQKQWWTNITGKTDTTGEFTTRGFLGDYIVTVTPPHKRGNNRAKTTKARLDKRGSKLTVIVQ